MATSTTSSKQKQRKAGAEKKASPARKTAAAKKTTPKKKADTSRAAKAKRSASSKTSSRPWKLEDQEKLARLVEDAIDKGATTAEEIHRDVSELPISVLESLELKETAAGVKKVRDASIGSIYKLIHDINHHVADLAVDLLKQREKQRR